MSYLPQECCDRCEGAQTREHHFIGKVNRSPSKTLGTLSLERVPGTETNVDPITVHNFGSRR